MKYPASFIAGFIVGIAAAVAAFTFWPRRSAADALTSLSKQSHAPTTASASPTSETIEPTATNLTEQTLQDALREIREAGMVVIPQELLHFYTPNLFGTSISSLARDTLRLDASEVTKLSALRGEFEQALMGVSDKNLAVVSSTNGLIIAKSAVPADARRQLIESTRDKIIASLDEESASLVRHLDVERALGSPTQLLKEKTLRIRRVEGDTNLHVTTTDGNYTRVVSMTEEQVTKSYPSLKALLPVHAKP